MDNIQFGGYNPSDDLLGGNSSDEKVFIHVVQRKTFKYITSVEGLEYYVDDIKSFMKKVRKVCSAGGSINKEDGTVQFQGNQKNVISDLLITEFDVNKDNIIFRGL